MEHITENNQTWLRSLRERGWLRSVLLVLLSAGFLLLQAVQMHRSVNLGSLLSLSLPVLALNCAVLLWAALVLRLLLFRWHWALLASALLSTLWSVANLFVLELHGSPLFISELRSFGTAMDVLGGYSLHWTAAVTRQIGYGFGLLALAGGAFLLREPMKGKLPRSLLKGLGLTAALLAGLSAVLWLLLFVWQTPKPRKTMGWTWSKGVRSYGYVCAIVEDVDRAANAYVKPAGYDAAHLNALSRVPQPEPPVKPDVILILNESFCDLHEQLDYTTDVDELEDFYSLQNAVFGKAVVTSREGHTNNTEYELLTSNAMHLLSVAAPFNYVNLSRTPHTLPRYLQSLGYKTAAMHCGSPSNYARNRVYPEMGFDRVVLGPEQFTRHSYGNRPWLDEDNYADLISLGEEMGDGPKLLYLLTFQGHGGYEANPPELDTVHVREDFGEKSDELNEYLTSIRMSSAAFRALTEHYSKADRPVIICMLGDHIPALFTDLPMRPTASEAEQEVMERTVPYVIWSNYGAEVPTGDEYMTVTDLVPSLLRAAGLPLSTYYRLLLQLHAEIPARTLHGYYRDADGSTGLLTEHPAYGDLCLYYELEYNGLVCGGDYREDLFLP